MDCDVEPIVDPCGSVVPFIDGWSLECWVKYKEQIIFPSYHKKLNKGLLMIYQLWKRRLLKTILH